MPQIRFENEPAIDVPSTSGEESPTTVLAGLERGGLDIPFGCRSGACHKCLLRSRSKSGRIDPGGQVGLSPFEIAAGHFLSCSTRVSTDLSVARPDWQEPVHTSSVVNVTKTESRYRVDVEPWNDDFAFPGRQCGVVIDRADESRGPFSATIGVQRALWFPGGSELEDLQPGTPLRISDATGLAFVPDERDLVVDHAFLIFDAPATATAAILARVLHARLIRGRDARNSLRVITSSIPTGEVETALFDRIPIEFAPDDVGESLGRILGEYDAGSLERGALWALGAAELVLPLRGVAFRAGIPIRNGTRATSRDPLPPS